MDKRVSKTSKIAATILLVVNMFVMVLSCFLFALGLWTIVSSPSLVSAIQFTGISVMKALLPPEVLTVQLGVAVAVLATFLFFVSFMGFYGAACRSQFLLFMYSTLVLLLLLLECSLIYYFTSNLVEKGLQEDDGQWTHALRLAFSCCDRNYTFLDSVTPPWSCCGPAAYPNNCTAGNLQKKNCQETISNWLQRNQITMYALLTALHLILSSCSIIRRHRGASRSQS